jgi:hypothetical protein
MGMGMRRGRVRIQARTMGSAIVTDEMKSHSPRFRVGGGWKQKVDNWVQRNRKGRLWNRVHYLA